jgi:peptidoglycan/LPS O-acetylase OafA/YrhL
MDTPPRLGYMPALDGLRAVAIVLVVAYHSVPGLESGMVGVDVFFVLSGFLITSLIADGIRTGEFSRRRFYARRAIRLVPALVVTVVVFAPIAAAVTGPAAWFGAIAALLYLTPVVPLTIFSHTWSLAYEEWFYLLWPLILGRFFRDQLTMRQAAALMGALAALIQASMTFAPGSIFARPSALLAGVALGLWWLDGGRIARPVAAVSGGLALILIAGLGGGAFWQPSWYWLAVVGATLVVGGVASGGMGLTVSTLGAGPLVAVGVVSYEWYLIHAPMLVLAHELWGTVSYWAAAPASLVLAFALHRVLAPLQAKLRERVTVTDVRLLVAVTASVDERPGRARFRPFRTSGPRRS